MAVCKPCYADGQASLYTLQARLRKSEQKDTELNSICRSCAGLTPGDEVACDSRDCPVFYSRVRHSAALVADKADVDPAIKALHKLNMDW